MSWKVVDMLKNLKILPIIKHFRCGYNYLCGKKINSINMSVNHKQYNSVVMAKYIVAYANEHGYIINMTKLQKLLYIAYGVCLSAKGERLVDEHPQAWPFGPVFPTTRNKLLNISFDSINMDYDGLEEVKSDREMNILMRLVFSSYGNNSASSLSEWSHKEGSPWHRTTNTKGFQWGDTIPDEYIEDYFNKLITYKK